MTVVFNIGKTSFLSAFRGFYHYLTDGFVISDGIVICSIPVETIRDTVPFSLKYGCQQSMGWRNYFPDLIVSLCFLADRIGNTLRCFNNFLIAGSICPDRVHDV